MKLTFSLFLLFSFSSFPHDYQKKVVFSGPIKSWQRNIITKFLDEHGLKNSPLIHWDKLNQNCQIREFALIQFCSKKDEIKVVKMDQRLVKRTLGRLNQYAQTTKALTKESSYVQ